MLLSGSYGYELFEKSMQSKTIPWQRLLIGVLTGFAFFLALLFYFIARSSILDGSALLIENITAPSTQEQTNLPAGQAGSGLPLRLKIPGIDVDAAVQYVGIAPDGAMDIPKSPDDVAWLKFGPRPGENGSAVIAGHYGIKNGKASVFDDLHKLRKGDKLYIEDSKGTTISFVVRENRRYNPKADASNVFGSSDGKSHLNLVTCEGVWNKASQGYPQRLVVFADRE